MNNNRWNRNRPLFSSPVPAKKPTLVWRVLPILWLALKRTCMVLGVFMLISLAASFFFISTIPAAKAPSLPGNMVLYITLEGDLAEMPEETSLGDLFVRSEPTVHELVDIIDRASGDARVKGIMARMESGSFSMARSAELRDAVKRFRAAGKFADIYSSSFGEGGGDLGRYYLASAFGQIWMQPMGIVSIPGVRAEIPFFREALDKIGVTPQFYKRKEYKTAYESATNKTISPENREEINDVIQDIRGQILKDIPKDRAMSPEAFERLVQHGLFTAPEAMAARLVDRVDYADVLVERIKTDVAGDPEASDDLFVDPAQYADAFAWEDNERRLVQGSFGSARPGVALIYVVGAIMESDIGGNPLMGDHIAASETIVPAIMDAADDESIQALVLRVDSPGGSPVASESILRAVERVKKKGKPVIVSMGTAAASGGYWVSAYADQIFAQPTTLTGSIGVLGGKVSAGDLWKTIGVNWDRSIQWGGNAGMWTMNAPFSASEEERVNAMLDHVYKSFVERVAKGRGLSVEQVDNIARGRVWTGTEASRIGLVDKIGGLREAMNYTAQVLGAKDKTGIDVVILPAPRTVFEKFLELVEDGGGVYEGLRLQQRIAAALGPFLEAAGVMQASPGGAAYEPLRIE